MRLPSGFWRKCRVTFRWCRITVWLLVLAVICAFVWFNRIGLPDFLKRPLIEKLREQGIELAFSRLQLHVTRGLVAENVHLGDVNIPDRPRLSLAEVQLQLNFRALLHRRLEVNGLILRDGKLVWPISSTNALTLDHIQTHLRFQMNDTWSLDHFQADFAGMKLAFSGDIAHAPEIRNWKIFRAENTSRVPLQQQLKKISAALNKIHFEGAPQLNLAVDGDARAIRSFVARLALNAPAAQTPWGGAHDIQLAATLSAPTVSTNFNAPGNWWTNALQALRLKGKLAFTDGTALGGTIGSLHTHFSRSNLVWQLSDFTVAQAKTKLELNAEENDATGIFNCRIRGAFDPETLRPFLTARRAARALDHFTFTEPLALDVAARGCLNNFDSLGANGQIALTNFMIRGQSFGSVAGELSYTNRVLKFFHPHLLRENGTQTMTADTITLNFNERLIYFTNGFSTADPLAVARAIGPKTGELLEPYHFLQPPTAHVNGCAPMHDVNGVHDVDDADLRFDILRPAPFQWLKLKTPDIMGTIHWLGETLVLTNVTAAFYGGSGNGFADFDFRPAHKGADYQFMVAVTNVDLHSFTVDLSTPTNHLEGVLAGKLFVTHADTRDWQTWDGFGHVDLRDGLLWDIPIFGILSPVLNAFVPGLGNSRATDASANFTMTNGVIFTDSLEIQSLMARLDYTGTVDLRGNVNARVTARLLRNTWWVGPLISTMTWPVSKLFEYQVSGTLENPRSNPVYVPKILLMPLHPIRSFQQMMIPGGNSSSNSPTIY